MCAIALFPWLGHHWSIGNWGNIFLKEIGGLLFWFCFYTAKLLVVKAATSGEAELL